ncbi:hypothetical protein AC481_02335 [miscellaneous Crenarchaeota group archaeon SMTZ-80]|nr:MAG: hypothetical protein AC481_02335 [miscellaneous Crenarchaeota group archaeon SMTZ-80]
MKGEKISRRKYITIASAVLIAAMFGGVGNYLFQKKASPIKGSNVTSDSSIPTTFEPSVIPTPGQNSTISSTPIPTTAPIIDVTPIPSDTIPKMVGEIRIDRDSFSFQPEEIKTRRPDLFNPGYFSVFDVLHHLHNKGLIKLEYHFEESLITHVVDSINGESSWRYQIYYDNGWPERNIFRMDRYPWKDRSNLGFYKANPTRLNEIYSIFRNEVARRKSNNGKLIIPKVIIRGQTFTKEFKDVEVEPYNMRYDLFKKDLTTALDVVMSLGDQGKIKYELKWMESIGRAEVVKNYWVWGIDDNIGQNRCGFVYEAGSVNHRFSGNHIHLPTDSRILNSPEYVEFFWICL